MAPKAPESAPLEETAVVGGQRVTTHSSKPYKQEIVWKNVSYVAYFTVGAVYGLYLWLAVCSWATFFWTIYLFVIGSLGTSAGVHRLWSHKAYKAKLPLRIFLAYCSTTCFMNSIYVWVRDHRVHHKFVDTNADPHNSTRGFFFSHVGWLLRKKHPDVIEKGRGIYMKDMEADPIVMFQKKHYSILMPLFCFILPAVVPWYFWGESLSVAWYTASVFRYMMSINGTWLVNSAAHMYGMRPYDKNINPRENAFVAYFTLGEGWHNYHHVFPWDYKTSEFGGYNGNFTTAFIDGCAKLGLAYDLKTVPEEMVKKRVARTGEDADAANGQDQIEKVKHSWGWGDTDVSREEERCPVTFPKL